MTITLTNPNATAITGAQFTDDYPPGPGIMANMASGNPVVSSTCSGGAVIAATSGASTSLVNGTIPASGSCEVVISVVGTAAGGVLNNTGAVTSANATSSSGAQGMLTVRSGPQLNNAPTVTEAFAPMSVTSGGTSQMTITLTNSNALPITGVAMSDTYPSDMTNELIGGVQTVVSNTCSGTVSVGQGMTLSNGTIPASGSCAIEINVVGGSVPGPVINNTGTVTSANAPNGASAQATLTVTSGPLLGSPTATKTFAPTSVVLLGASQMQITLTNPNTSAIIGAEFIDSYPAGMSNALPGTSSGVTGNNTCGGTLTTANGTSPTAALSGGTIPAAVGGTDGSCVVTIPVIGTTVGNLQNFVSLVLSSNAQTQTSGTNARATLTVTSSSLLNAPIVNEAFYPASVLVGGTSQMVITLTNVSSSYIYGVQLIDNYPAGIMNSASGGVQSTCGGGVTAPPGGSFTSMANDTIPPNSSCEVAINVVGTLGMWTNDTGPVWSANAVTGSDAQATLTVNSGSLLTAPQVTKAFSPASIANDGVTASQMTITLTNSNGSPITGVQFSDQYPGGIANASGNPLVSNTCGGMVTQQFYGAPETLVNGTIPPASDGINGSCAVVINVVSTGQAGNWTNHTGPVWSGNATPGADAQATLTVTSGTQSQTITFTSPSPTNATVGGATYAAAATASSGLPVILTMVMRPSNGVCAIGSGVVSFWGAGICTIDANQGGNATFAAAPQVQQSIMVGSASGASPQIVCTLLEQVYLAGAVSPDGTTDVVTIDMTKLFLPPADNSLSYSVTGLYSTPLSE